MFDRVKEPSSMAGVAAIAGGINEVFVGVDPELVDAGIAAAGTLLVNPTPVGIGMALFGLFSVFMKEKKNG